MNRHELIKSYFNVINHLSKFYINEGLMRVIIQDIVNEEGIMVIIEKQRVVSSIIIILSSILGNNTFVRYEHLDEDFNGIVFGLSII